MKKLPPKDIYEFAWYYWNECPNDDPSIIYRDWLPSNWTYSQDERERFKIIFDQHEQFIEQKNVIDIGCHMGLLSYFALECGAKSITGIDRNRKAIEFAPFLLDLGGHSAHNFIHGDITDSNLLDLALQDQQTVILSGVVQCISNHTELFDTIGQAESVESVIIYDKIKDLHNDRPAIYFSLEDMTPRPERDEYTYGLDFTQDIHPTLVQGKPNMAWYDMIMHDHLGFTLHSHTESTHNNWCRVWTRNQ